MRNHRVLSVGLALLLLSGFFAGLAMAENDSLYVVMTAQDRHYSVGDTITVQVMVYDKGVLADADNITLGMSLNYNFNNPVELNLTKQDTGIYQAAYTVKASDNHHHLYFFYSVQKGWDSETVTHHEDALVVDVYSVQDTVDVSFYGQKTVSARPGDVVTATILVRTGDTPIPVTGFDHLYVEDQDGNRQNLSYRAQATGIYLADFIIPDVVRTSTYQIYADPIDVGDHDSAVIVVNVLDVWSHKLISGTTTSIEICVADMTGQPVEGASFWIQRQGWPNEIHTGTTNASGKSLVAVTEVYGTVGFGGYVQASGLNQTIEGAVMNPVAEQPHGNAFDIIWGGSQTVFAAGTDVSIPYGAYDSTVPAGSRTIYYYVEAVGTDFAMSSHGAQGTHVGGTRVVVASGSVITNPTTGGFNLDFRTPDRQCTLNIHLETPLGRDDFPNEAYDHDDDMYYGAWPEHQWDGGFVFLSYEGHLNGDGTVGIGGGKFNPGETGTVTVSMEKLNGDMTMAQWTVGRTTMEQMDSYDPEWMSWVPAGNAIMLHPNDRGELEGDFHVPVFIENQDVTVVAGYVGADGIPHFDSRTISPGGISYSLWLIIIIIIAVVAAVAAVFIKFHYF